MLLQAAFTKAKKLFSPEATGAVLCGQKQMAEVLQCFLFTNCFLFGFQYERPHMMLKVMNTGFWVFTFLLKIDMQPQFFSALLSMSVACVNLSHLFLCEYSGLVVSKLLGFLNCVLSSFKQLCYNYMVLCSYS